MSRDDDPIARFAREYERAGATEQFEVSRCALATADEEGRPTVRFVLLKGFDQTGFVFFTNFESAKAKHLAVNPHAEIEARSRRCPMKKPIPISQVEIEEVSSAHGHRGRARCSTNGNPSRRRCWKPPNVSRVFRWSAHHFGAATALRRAQSNFGRTATIACTIVGSTKEMATCGSWCVFALSRAR